jgi:hypothetical protein
LIIIINNQITVDGRGIGLTGKMENEDQNKQVEQTGEIFAIIQCMIQR